MSGRLLLTVLGALVIGASWLALSTPANAVTHPKRGGSLPPRSVLALDMFTPRAGVALAEWPVAVTTGGHYFIVRTNSGGATWTITGELPAAERPAFPLAVDLAFSSVKEGYVMVPGRTRIAFTRNGGKNWSLLALPGPATGISLEDTQLWVTTSTCSQKSSRYPSCPTRLVEFPEGAPAASSATTIPTEGPVLTGGVSSRTYAATLLSRRGPVALFAEGQDRVPNSLLLTLDAGLRWTVVANPCSELTVNGLVQLSPTEWILYCALDGGMNQGTNEIWTTSDSGSSWVVTATGSEQDQPPSVGDIGDGMAHSFTASADGHVLWLLGNVYGLEYSLDGGHTWVDVAIQTGGATVSIATAGDTQAWLPLLGVGLYHTADGILWNRLDATQRSL